MKPEERPDARIEDLATQAASATECTGLVSALEPPGEEAKRRALFSVARAVRPRRPRRGT